METLKNEIKNVIDSTDIGISIYTLLKNDEIRKLDVESKSLNELKKMFIDYINSEIISDQDKSVLKISSADERGNVIYEYDLDLTEDFTCFSSLDENVPLFNAKHDLVTDIDALIIEIGNNDKQILLYKNIAPISIIRRKEFILGIKSNERFERLNQELLKITPNFQFLKTKSNLYILELKALERLFGFQEVIKREAVLGFDRIKNYSVLENPEVLEELLEDISFARKLTKINKHSPIFRHNIPTSKIIDFCSNFPAVKGKIRFNANKDKILLDTNISKTLFIKILLDEYLTSELTDLHYSTLAKDEIQ